MAIVEMKRIELLAMRQDQRKLLKAMQKMGCVEVSPIKDEALKAYQGKDSARLQQLDSLMERLRWTIGQLSQYNKQKAPFMGNLPDAEPQEIAYIQSHEAEMIAIIDKAEGLEKTGGDLKGQLARLQVAQEQLLQLVAKATKRQIKRTQRNQTRTRSSLLYLNMLNEMRFMAVQVRALTNDERNFVAA